MCVNVEFDVEDAAANACTLLLPEKSKDSYVMKGENNEFYPAVLNAEDPFAPKTLENVTSTSNFDYVNYRSFEFYFDVILLVLKVILFTTAFFANVFLIHIIRTSKRLKENRINNYIMYYSICYANYLASFPLQIIIFIFSYSTSIVRVLYVIRAIGTSSLCISYLVIIFVGVEWCENYYKVNFIYKTALKSYLLPVICIFYCLTLTIFTVCSLLPFIYSKYLCSGFETYFLGFAYISSFCFLVVINIINKSRPRQRNTKNVLCVLTVANIAIFSQVFQIIYDSILYEVIFHKYAYLFLFYTGFIPECLSYGHPVAIVFALGIIDTNFRAVYDSKLKRSVQHYKEETNENSSDDEINGQAVDENLNNSII